MCKWLNKTIHYTEIPSLLSSKAFATVCIIQAEVCIGEATTIRNQNHIIIDKKKSPSLMFASTAIEIIVKMVEKNYSVKHFEGSAQDYVNSCFFFHKFTFLQF